MSEGNLSQQRFIKELLKMIKCGICGERYASRNVSVLGHHEELWFVSVTCDSCQTHGLVAAMVKQGKAVESVTDLSGDEYARFREGQPVSTDDVLDMHNFLKQFNGDIAELLSS